MSDKLKQIGDELELTPEQWQDFHEFFTAYWARAAAPHKGADNRA